MISIVIPVFNVENFIAECLDSVLAQTYQDFEAILIDDGSTDTSGRVCEEYVARDHRFRVFHTKNRGVGSARNTGLELANGEYCFFLDPDDVLESDSLQHLLDLLNVYKADIALGVSSNFSGQMRSAGMEAMVGSYVGPDEIMTKVILDKRDLKPLRRKAEQPNVNWEFFSALYRMDIVRVNKLRFLTISYGEDTYLCFAYLLQANKAVTSGKTVYWHRRNPTSATFRYHKDYLAQTKIYYQEYSALFAEHAPKYLQQVLEGLDAQYFNRCVSAIERELFTGSKSRKFHEVNATLKEIGNDDKFRKLLTGRNVARIGLKPTRLVMQGVKLRLYPLLASAAFARNWVRK